MDIENGNSYLAQVKELIIEYTNSLGRDLSFQNLDSELKNIAEKYTAPNGEILVAVENGNVYGMVCYHKHSNDRCEMKRLYVRPAARGMHIGEKLVEEIIKRAKAAGYIEMVLDTIEPLKKAISLYEKMGFERCEPYYNNPMDDVIYMKKYL
ncbi:MAG: GNAT family N-acetyltransferase [Ruminococcus sp.]|nr:GNAT family N-acetyltransferase [Ruminococcus sp.]